MDLARTKVENRRSVEGEPDITIKYSYETLSGGYCFHYYNNNSKNNTTIYDYVSHTNLNNMKLLYKTIDNSPGDALFIIKPGEEKLFAIKMTDRPYQTPYTHLTLKRYSRTYLKKLTLENGQKSSIIPNEGDAECIYRYVYSHNFGRVFAFVNNHETLKVDVLIKFPIITNLELTSNDLNVSKNRNLWKFEVLPGQSVFKFLNTSNQNEPTNLSYTHEYLFLKPGEKSYSLTERVAPEELK